MKKFTSFCQVLKEIHTKESWLWYLQDCVDDVSTARLQLHHRGGRIHRSRLGRPELDALPDVLSKDGNHRHWRRRTQAWHHRTQLRHRRTWRSSRAAVQLSRRDHQRLDVGWYCQLSRLDLRRPTGPQWWSPCLDSQRLRRLRPATDGVRRQRWTGRGRRHAVLLTPSFLGDTSDAGTCSWLWHCRHTTPCNYLYTTTTTTTTAVQ